MADGRVVLLGLFSIALACGEVLAGAEDDPPDADAGADVVVAPRAPMTIGVYQPSGRRFALRNTNEPGPADRTVDVDAGAEVLPFAGHWNGAPEPGDWVGLHRPGVTPTFHLLSPISEGAVVQFGFDSTEALPLAGDWNGDGVSTIGFYVPSTGTFFLKDANGPGDADYVFSFGAPNALPLVGDWDGDTKEEVGVFFPGKDDATPGAFFLRGSVRDGGDANVISFNVITTGGPWRPTAGDWDNTGKARVGLFQPVTGQVRLLADNQDNAIETAFIFGGGDPEGRPVAGRWSR